LPKIDRSPQALNPFMRKNPPPFEPIHQKGEKEDIKRKRSMALVEPENHRSDPTPSAESLRKRLPPSALHTTRRRLKVSKTGSPSHCDAVGRNPVPDGAPYRGIGFANECRHLAGNAPAPSIMQPAARIRSGVPLQLIRSKSLILQPML
jgi:hypothetical protein